MRQTRTIPGLLSSRADEQPLASAYWQRTEEGQWQATTWKEIRQRVQNLACHLHCLGLRPGDNVVLMLPTRPNWEYCQLGVMEAGGVVVGIDAHDAHENIRHILQTVQPRALFLSTAQQWRDLRPLLTDIPCIVVLEQGHDAGTVELHKLLHTSAEDVDLPLVTSADRATIVFTSGSMGQPKGIAYTHGQLCDAAEGILNLFPTLDRQIRLACWLPMSNLFQRIVNLCTIMRGDQSFFVESPADIMVLLPEIRPALLIGVPRFFEKLYAGIQEKTAQAPWPMRKLVGLAWRMGEAYRKSQRAGHQPGPALSLGHTLAERLVLERIRRIMGPDMQFMVSGSAPMPLWLLERLHALGWLVLEAYGISECVLPVAMATPEAFRFGSVGRGLSGNEIRIAADGELLVRGPGVFRGGYLGAAAETTPVDEEGFLHTGDYGRLDEDGYLYLIGRKSEIFKTSTGRRIAPVPIESLLKQLPYVEHAVIMGSNRPMPVALLALKSMAGQVEETSDPATLNTIAHDVLRVCAELPAYQRPAGVLLTREGFSVLGGELTANLKLKRAAIAEKYMAAVDALYNELATATPRGHCLVREAA